jgi:hypothetical protein
MDVPDARREASLARPGNARQREDLFGDQSFRAKREDVGVRVDQGIRAETLIADAHQATTGSHVARRECREHVGRVVIRHREQQVGVGHAARPQNRRIAAVPGHGEDVHRTLQLGDLLRIALDDH